MFNNCDLLTWHSFDDDLDYDSSGNQFNAIEVVDVLSVARADQPVTQSLFKLVTIESIYEYHSFII